MAHFITALFCLLLDQTHVPAGTATAEGVVIDSTTGRPIPKASVDLSSSGFQFRTTTDAVGRFWFKNLLPDEYAFSAERPGFAGVKVGLGGMPGLGTVIAADDQLSGIVLKLRPQALIAGTVLAHDGKPLATPKIDIWKVNVEGGKKVIRAIQFASIDADGSFVIGGLAAGRYYLAASDGQSKVYYSNATAFSMAQPIDLIEGKEMRGVRFVIGPQKSFKISGAAPNPLPDSVVEERTLSLLDKDPLGAWGQYTFARPLGDHFSFASVKPGDYLIRGSMKVRMHGVAQTLYGRRELRADAATQVDITFSPAVKMKGRILNLPPAEGRPMLGAGLHNEEWDDSAVSGSDGSFILQAPPGSYKMFAGNAMQAEWWTKTILFAGKEIVDGRMEVTPAGGSFTVRLAKGHSIRGIVRDQAGRPVAGAEVAAWNDRSWVGVCTSDVIGRFKLILMPEQSLHVAAWADIEHLVGTSFEFTSAFEKQSTPVKVATGDPPPLDLIAIPRSASRQAMEKIK